MGKSLLRTIGTKTLCASFILLLVASATPVALSSPDPTIISLNPMEITVPAPGENFTVAVNVTDVSGLAAWELKLSYNTTILDAVYVHRDPAWPEPPYTWTPKGTDLQFHPDGPPTINDTAGRVWVGCVIPFGSELTGNYTLVTIEFNATAMGNSTLHLYETALYDWLFVPIEHVTLDGSATVIPEFPAVLVLPLILTATLGAAYIGKLFWSRKRKIALLTE